MGNCCGAKDPHDISSTVDIEKMERKVKNNEELVVMVQSAMR